MADYTLISIKFSHFNDKVRWALDRFGVPYEERGYMPLFHMPFALVASRGRGKADAISSPASTPILITPQGPISDSTRILEHLCATFCDDETTLYPSPEAKEMELGFAKRLGAHTRRLAYLHLLPNREMMGFIADRNVGATQAKLFKVAYPVVRRMTARALRVNEKGGQRSLERINEVFAEVDERLSDGRRYLLGDRFTAADLSFACMSAPILAVQPEEGYGAVLVPLDRLPESYAVHTHRLRATAAGRFALRMFAEERS